MVKMTTQKKEIDDHRMEYLEILSFIMRKTNQEFLTQIQNIL
jgi:hypothetical protein